MSTQLVFGLLVLVALIGYQAAARYYHAHKTQEWWLKSKEAWVAGDLPAATNALERCLKWAPLAVAPRVLLATALARQGRLKEAEDHLRMAADLQPKEASGYVELALFYASACTGRMADAASALERALKCDPQVATQLLHDRRFDQLREVPELKPMLTADTP
ncbi:MAG: tetratricopeptide repeat protein [Candidatus Hydrogenedentes bacterium]|nr:tetratricopeptide repeat protein [Candidatus Hydrogenedentota bacterium]